MKNGLLEKEQTKHNDGKTESNGDHTSKYMHTC